MEGGVDGCSRNLCVITQKIRESTADTETIAKNINILLKEKSMV